METCESFKGNFWVHSTTLDVDCWLYSEFLFSLIESLKLLSLFLLAKIGGCFSVTQSNALMATDIASQGHS